MTIPDQSQQAEPEATALDLRRRPPFWAQTVHGYDLDVVVSCLQKTIRRGLVDEALFWAAEMNESGFGHYCWRRLLVITSEDIGLAVAHAPMLVASLYANALAYVKHRKVSPVAKANPRWDGLSLFHAVAYLARARKNRELADAYSTIELRMARGDLLEVPDFALDNHTHEGRSMGRGEDFFQRVGRQVEPLIEIDGDPWAIRYRIERSRIDRDGKSSG